MLFIKEQGKQAVPLKWTPCFSNLIFLDFATYTDLFITELEETQLELPLV